MTAHSDALSQTYATLAAENAARQRFFTATEGRPATDDQRKTVAVLTEAVRQLGELIIDLVPEGRNKSLALTALEDVQMRSNRAIFEP